MTPGTFRITPVSIKIENENIVFNNGRDELKILVKDFENGTVIVQTVSVPAVPIAEDAVGNY